MNLFSRAAAALSSADPALAGVQLPDYAVEVWPIDRIKPDPRNVNKHPQSQLDELRGSMREFGQVWPCLVNPDGQLIAGEGRFLALKQEGVTSVKVIVARGWSELQCRKFALLDNRIPRNAEIDRKLLGVEVVELGSLGVDVSQLGFTAKEIAKFAPLPPPGATDADAETPEPPPQAVTIAGDLWQLGDHRLLCGDSTRRSDVEKLLGERKPQLMVTDQPYGVDYDPDWRNSAAAAAAAAALGRTTAKSGALGKVENDDRADWRAAWELFEGDVAYVWTSSLLLDQVIAALEATGFERRAEIIWAKNKIVVGRGHYHWQHESCWYVVRKGKSGRWQGDRKQSTVWNIDKPQKSETGHSTQKPVECMRRPIENNSLHGDAVYEPFSGSGTTIMAAEQTGRHCLAIELVPGYVDVAIERWQAYTGRQATLIGDGRTFAEISAARRAGQPAAETAAAATDADKAAAAA